MSGALRAGFALADKMVPTWALPALSADALIKAAGVRPSAEAAAGLAALMAALAKDTSLSFFGRVSVRWDMIRLLRNAAKIEAAHARNPALGAAPIAAPLFILGLPRSGTSFLHTLLAEDAASLVPRNWQTMAPAPRPADFEARTDQRVRLVNRQLKLFAGLAPGFAQLHPIHADSPQECSEITSHVFHSLRFDTVFRVPDYLAWLEHQGDLPGFMFHRRFLQFLQDGVPGRWVLKCPDHTFSLDAILAVYPDARFIVVHRDPMEVLASVAHLTEVLRRPFVKDIDAAEIGAQVTQRWIEGARRLVAFDQRTDIAPARKIHISHAALVTQPMLQVAAIYRQFGMELSAAAETAMAAQLAVRPDGGYGRHAPYSLSRFNIDPAWLQRQFAFYVKAQKETS